VPSDAGGTRRRTAPLFEKGASGMMPVSIPFQAKFRAVVLLFVAAAFVQPYLMCQEKAAAQYSEEEYKAMEEIKGQADPAQKTALVVKFFKAYPKSGLKEYVIGDFVAMMAKLQEAQKWSEVTNYGRHVVPFDPSNQYLIAYLAEGYRQTKNYKAFAEFGEQAYQRSPSGNLAYYLAKAYLEIGNMAKFLQWGETTVGKMPENYEILMELVKQYSAIKNDAKADAHAKQAVKVLSGMTKPPQGMSEADWKKYTDWAYATCYYEMGYYANQQNNYKGAVTNLENSVKHYRRNDAAYYYLGQAYWRLNSLAMAMKNFAKAYLLNGPTSVAAKQHLDNLYKQTNRGSLTGLDKILARAQEELK
jgi:tetratricopeptide (TPR) repeat protein